MAHDGYDAYEVLSPDGYQQLCTANTLGEVRVAARTQIEDGHAHVLYGPTGFDHQQAPGMARNVWGKPVLQERAMGWWVLGCPWVVVYDN